MYIEKYLAGHRLEVWKEIETLKLKNLSEDTFTDILSVCKETMLRVRKNTKKIISALESIGYDFSLYPDGSKHFFKAPFLEPDKELEEKIKIIETKAGTLPLTLKVFWENIGGICLVGRYDTWPEHSDQLVAASVNDNIEELEDWIEMKKEDDEFKDAPFMLYISPDDYHKDNVSGGQWYNIEIPCDTVDAIVHDLPNETTFVNYLRTAFDAKGFPGSKNLPPEFDELNIELLSF